MKAKAEEFDTTEALLGLVQRRLTKAHWNRWNERMRKEATDWAAAVHLKASDNIIRKKRLIEPKHVKMLPKILPNYGGL